CGVWLSIFRNTPNEEQTALTINGLRILIIVLPIIFVILAAFLYHKAVHLKGDFLTDIEKTLQYKRQREHRERMSKEGGTFYVRATISLKYRYSTCQHLATTCILYSLSTRGICLPPRNTISDY